MFDHLAVTPAEVEMCTAERNRLRSTLRAGMWDTSPNSLLARLVISADYGEKA
jgi:hypothetical protein